MDIFLLSGGEHLSVCLCPEASRKMNRASPKMALARMFMLRRLSSRLSGIRCLSSRCEGELWASIVSMSMDPATSKPSLRVSVVSISLVCVWGLEI